MRAQRHSSGLVLAGAPMAFGGVQLSGFNNIGFTGDMTADRVHRSRRGAAGSEGAVGCTGAAFLFAAFEVPLVTLPPLYAAIPSEPIYTIPFSQRWWPEWSACGGRRSG